jgi:hypothetical protein
MLVSKPVVNSLASLLLLLSNSATSLALPAESANNDKDLQPETDVTSLSVNDACKYEHGSDFSAQAVGNGCNDWVCVRGNERYGVDLRLWCEMSVGDGTCYTYASCSNGIYDWRCNYEPC